MAWVEPASAEAPQSEAPPPSERVPHSAARQTRWLKRVGRLLESVRAVPKTVLFNLVYFPFTTAILVPVVVRHTVRLKRMSGTVRLVGEPRPGGIKLGFGNEGHCDRERERTVWDVSGAVTLGQGVKIHHGARISVGSDGALSLGDSVLVNSGATILCHHAVTVGKETRIAWETLVMDSDFHQLFDADGNRTNSDAPVRIGERVWIGARAIVLKGSVIPDHCVVGAGALVNRVYEESALLIAGNPGRIYRRGINWHG